jgi:hypothetical protein
MHTHRPTWLIALAFLAGCLTTAAIQVPRARADSAAVATRWEYWCIDVDGVPKNHDLEKAGSEGWELAGLTFRPPLVANGGSFGGGATLMCFKRPR